MYSCQKEESLTLKEIPAFAGMDDWPTPKFIPDLYR
jgi:hypothetical protein